MNIHELQTKGKLLEPVVRIGKNGMTENVIMQIQKALMKRKLIKIKFLRSFSDLHDAHAAGRELASKLSCELVDVVGNVIVLATADVHTSKQVRSITSSIVRSKQ